MQPEGSIASPRDGILWVAEQLRCVISLRAGSYAGRTAPGNVCMCGVHLNG